MSSIARPPERPRSAGRPPEDVDDLLREFFCSEVPTTWPTLTAPPGDPRRGSAPVDRPRIALSSRFALAAAVAFVVVGLWSLSSRFPVEPQLPGASLNPGPTLGSKGVQRLRSGMHPGGPSTTHALPARSGEAVEPTRNGGEALLQWEQLPDGLFMRIEEKRPPRR